MQSISGSAAGNLDSIIKAKMPALGIDLGGTKILCAPVAQGKVLVQPIKVATPQGRQNIIDRLIDLIKEFQKDYVLVGVGIATAGIVNPNTGEVVGSTGNLPGWEGTKLKQILEPQIFLPVHVENDANAAAYGEAHERNLKDKECVVLLTIGTGLGSGILIKNQLFRGQHYGAGECGHIKIALNNQRLCTCGLFDCFEAYVSGRGLLATAREVLADRTKKQSNLVSNLESLTTEALFAAASSGDILAQKSINIWHEHLVFGMVSIAHTLDPDCFILSGGLSKFVDIDYLRELFYDRSIPHIGKNISFYPSALETHAGIVGAAQIVLDKITIT
jgi:glucokinase